VSLPIALLVDDPAPLLNTEDGQGGRLARLQAAGTPMVLCTHWQSLFANGRRTGLLALDEVCRRVSRLWGDGVQWTTCNELAADVAAGRWAKGMPHGSGMEPSVGPAVHTG
jgi:hypothetical protein